MKPEKYQHDYHSHNDDDDYHDDYETNHHHPNDMKTLRANPLSEVGIAVIAAAAFSLFPIPGKDSVVNGDNEEDDEMMMMQ